MQDIVLLHHVIELNITMQRSLLEYSSINDDTNYETLSL